MIQAVVMADDKVHFENFDATPWFEQAPMDRINVLRAKQWERCEVADEIMHWVRDQVGSPYLKEFSDYCNKHGKGYEVYINDKDAEEFLIERAGIDAANEVVDYLLSQRKT